MWGNIMTRRKFDIKMSDGAILKHQEDSLKYITGKQNRYSHIEYPLVDGNIVPVIKYDIFNQYSELIHGFSTRMGGVSKDHLSSMNLSFSRGDDKENVIENHRRFGEALGYDSTRLVFSDQVHDISIKKVTSLDVGKGITIDSDIKNIDGLVTNESNIPLITFFADCVPLYFYDPANKVIGLAHSGWKGTVAKIGTKMIEIMTKEYGSNPEDIICAIGPSICKSCYEVSQDVAVAFKDAYSEEEYTSMIVDKGNEKFLLDLHMACKYNLLNAGVMPEHIAMPDLCTCCNSSVLFSHRASNGMRGNLAAVMMLK